MGVVFFGMCYSEVRRNNTFLEKVLHPEERGNYFKVLP